jgi:hypothetical protein
MKEDITHKVYLTKQFADKVCDEGQELAALEKQLGNFNRGLSVINDNDVLKIYELYCKLQFDINLNEYYIRTHAAYDDVAFTLRMLMNDLDAVCTYYKMPLDSYLAHVEAY